MTYEVYFDPSAKKQLTKLDPPVQERILKKISSLKKKPDHFANHLSGVDLWKLRVGDYRVLFDLYREDSEIYIIKVGHRKDIYRDL